MDDETVCGLCEFFDDDDESCEIHGRSVDGRRGGADFCPYFQLTTDQEQMEEYDQ